MIPAERIAEIRAGVSLRELIGRDVGLKRAGKAWWGLCPFHHEGTPSFMVDESHYHCFGCGAHGDAIGYLMRAKSIGFTDAVAQLSAGGVSGRGRRAANGDTLAPVGASPAPCSPADTPHQVTELWDAADAPAIAEFYLRSRWLLPRGTIPAALRGHNRVLYSEPCWDEKPIVEPSWRTWRDPEGQWWKGQHRPAMLAAVTAPDGLMTGLQRIWCERKYVVDASQSDPQDARAVGLSARKKTLGHLGTGAVRLAPAGRTLGLAESVEDALAASIIYKIPCWAICGVSRLGRPRTERSPERAPTIWLPPITERLFIFADNDQAGEIGAIFAADWWTRHGVPAQPVFPAKGKDFNEMLRS